LLELVFDLTKKFFVEYDHARNVFLVHVSKTETWEFKPRGNLYFYNPANKLVVVKKTTGQDLVLLSKSDDTMIEAVAQNRAKSLKSK
jgi:hypothetical protein